MKLKRSRKIGMKNNFKLFVVLTLGCILLLTSFTGCGEKKSSVIRVGGKNYTEQFIIAEMLGILIKENTDLDVSVQQNLVDNVMFDAIKAMVTAVLPFFLDVDG